MHGKTIAGEFHGRGGNLLQGHGTKALEGRHQGAKGGRYPGGQEPISGNKFQALFGKPLRGGPLGRCSIAVDGRDPAGVRLINEHR